MQPNSDWVLHALGYAVAFLAAMIVTDVVSRVIGLGGLLPPLTALLS